MGLEWLLGGSTQKRTPGTEGFISNIQDWAKNIGTTLSPVGRQAKRGLKAFKSGDYDSNPALSGYFAPIRDAYATSVREGERSATMGVGAKFGQDNPIVAQRISQLNEERAREGEGQALTRAVPALYQTMSDTFHQDAAQRDSRTAMQGQGLMAALQGYLSSFYQKQQGGLLPALSQAAQGAGALAAGFSSPGGGSLPAIGGTNSNSFYNIINSAPAYAHP
jgi:hypothetical protein